MDDRDRYSSATPFFGVAAVVGVLLLAVVGGGAFLFFRSARQAEQAAREAELARQVATGELARRLDEMSEEVQHYRTGAPIDRTAVLDPGAKKAVAALSPSDVASMREDLAAARSAGHGAHVLQLLLELAEIDAVHLPEASSFWSELANASDAELDRLGLSKIALAAALASSPATMRHALENNNLDPSYRQFVARTLEQASTATRRAILDAHDFSKEKDKAVLHAMVRATRGFQDERYIDRFTHLVTRTDLYNDSRSSIAFRIAEIAGTKSRAAIDQLRQQYGGKGLFKRMLPVLESIHSPPATGLLVTNGMQPSATRIGHNDLILAYNGVAIRTRADLTRIDSKLKIGAIVPVKLMRNGAEHILQITVVDTAPGHLHFSSRAVRK